MADPAAMITLPDISSLTHEQATEECYAVADKIGREIGHCMAIASMWAELGYDDVGRVKDATLADARRCFEDGNADPDDINTIMSAIELAMLREAYIVSCASWLPMGGRA
jgi:hypothetical protein